MDLCSEIVDFPNLYGPERYMVFRLLPAFEVRLAVSKSPEPDTGKTEALGVITPLNANQFILVVRSEGMVFQMGNGRRQFQGGPA